MWILPRQLHTSVSALGMGELISDSSEQSQACARWLLVRSKPLPVRTWCLKWSRDSWTRHLSGRILRPSHGGIFEEWWTSSLGVTPASHSAPPVGAGESAIPVTSGRTLQMELPLCGPSCASLRTSKDISLWGCPTSSKTWQQWVIERRGAYSQRLKSERLTQGSGCSSWPSPVASEVRQGFQDRTRGKKGSQESLTTVVVKSWATPSAREWKGHTITKAHPQGFNFTLSNQVHGHQGMDSSSISGSHQESWATPNGRDWKDNGTTLPPSIGKTRGFSLGQQMVMTPTPGKLNPRWVETLMGLPVGWTMPSCASPMTIGQTS